MAMVRYCPKCGFEEENFEFDGCPQCGAQLMVRQTDGDKTQTVGSDNSRQHDSKVDIGMGAAVNGNITSNTSTVDNSTSNVVNNVTNIIKEKSDSEKHSENIKVYSRRCRALCNDGLLSKEGEKELEVLRNELGIGIEEARVILADAKKLSKQLRTVLDRDGLLRINKTMNIITGNRKDALMSELNALRGWKAEYDVDELNQLYYQLLAILTPKQFLAEMEDTVEENYWQVWWAVVAYQLVGLPSKADSCMAHINAWDSLYPTQNKILLSIVNALMQSDESTAREAFNALCTGYSQSLKSVADAVKDLLNMDWNHELATLPAVHQFYYDTLFKDYTSRCQYLAVERRKERKAEEERRRQKQHEAEEQERQQMRELEFIRAENERVANEAKLAAEQKEANIARARADEEKRKRLEAEHLAEKAERKRKRKDWWKRNRKKFAMAMGFVVLIIVSSNIYKGCQNKLQQKQAYEDSIRQDSIRFAERQQNFDELAAEFEKLINQPLYVDNAYQNIVDSRSVLQQMLQLLSDAPSLSGDTPKILIDRYNTCVDNAIKELEKAKDDLPDFSQNKQEINDLNIEIDNIQLLFFD